MGVLSQIQTDIDNAALNMVKEYRTRLYADAVKLCSDPTEAEDLVMLTFNRVFSVESGYDESKGEFYPWMRGVMQRIYVRMDRRKVNRQTQPVEQSELESLMGADDCTIEEVMRDSDAEAIRGALERLDPKYKQTLMLHYFSEMPAKEIAYVMKCPVGTVLWRMRAACRMLKKDLAQKLGKKSTVVLVAILLGVGTLFGAWQSGLFDSLFTSNEATVTEPSPADDLAPSAEQFTIQPKEGTNEMKNTSILKSVAAVALTTAALVSDGVTIDVTKFQQRYPWNGLVDIDYTITLSDGESALNATKHSVEITVVNRAETPAVTNVAHAFRQGALPVSAGAHRVTWDANAEGVNFKSQDVMVFAEIVHYAEKYMVIDISEGPDATEYPVTYYNGVPAGGFNTDEYKGDKIALRLIPPGSFVMGSPTTEPGRTANVAAREVQHAVAITKPFYIGIFQITQKQYQNVMNANPSMYKDNDGFRPVERVSYETIRGSVDGAKWPLANSVDGTSFMGKLRAKCKEQNISGEWEPVSGLFDLPTDAQWEYACRAGTTTPFNNGEPCANAGELDTQLAKLGRYSSNGGSQHQHAVVGTAGDSNVWGLYDMHGNIWEWCLDWYREDVQNIDNPSVDPVGPSADLATKPFRVCRGGSFAESTPNCRSAFRNGDQPTAATNIIGFRLSRTLP